MLKPGGKRESLVGKLLLSSALVAVSLAYGWWQQHDAERLKLAMVPAALPLAPKKLASIPPRPAVAPEPAAQDPMPAAEAGPGAEKIPNQVAAEPRKPSMVAKAAPQIVAPAAPESPPQSKDALPSPASAVPAAQTPPPNILPVDSDETQPFLITGTPDPAAKSPVPPGMHLEDGDYVSSRHQFMWGDLRIKIFVRGGAVMGVQALQFPDHRSQSLYLSGLSLPKLESEVIRKQTSQVDAVSSATDTSIVFQDAVADAITKATRG